MSPENFKPRPALCVTDGHRMTWLGGDLVEPLELPLAVWASPDPGGKVKFDLHKPGSAEAVQIQALGTHIAWWSDVDLMAVVLGGFFERAAEALKQVSGSGYEARTITPTSLYFPAWMGPRDRHRLRRAAARAGLRLRDGTERGFVPVLIRAGRGEPPPAAGGFVVADECGPDLDLYAIADETNATEQRTVQLTCYRRCRQVFSPYYEHREAERRRLIRETLILQPSGWPRLASSQGAAEMLNQVPAERAKPSTPEVLPFSAYPDSLTEPSPDLRILRNWHYWLDHGDQRLAPLSQGVEGFPWRRERLFTLPAETPQQVEVAVHAGYTAVRGEAHELCRLTLSKPDFYTAPGHLLVTVELTGAERGRLTLEMLQHGRTVAQKEITFPGETEES